VPTPFRFLTIHEATDLLRTGQASSEDLTRMALERIKAVDGKVRAFVTVTEEHALAQAREADRRRKSGETGPLLGVPWVVKDNMNTLGIRTTCSSRMLENYIPVYNAHVVERLNASGAVAIGKANMDEYALGSSTENSAFFPTHNPWNLDYVPGGSSGGSAAAVAAGEGIFALGSDTGGSIRQPASLCGVVGIKPTYGRVSRYGLIAFGSSLDQIGPLTQDVRDAALVMNAISGYDKRDSTSLDVPVPDYKRALRTDVKGLRIGIVREMLGEGIDEPVKAAVLEAARVLERAGARVDMDASLPASAKYALAVYYILAPAELSANLARYDGVKYGYSYQGADTMWEAMEKSRAGGFGPEVKRRIFLGTYALSAGYYDAYYKKAQQVRTIIRREFEAAFQQYDVLLTPTSPTLPFKLGDKTDNPVRMYLNDICTIPVNIAGVPGLSIPCGIEQGLPIGLQLIGKALDEETLFRVAYTYEQATDWHKKHPEL